MGGVCIFAYYLSGNRYVAHIDIADIFNLTFYSEGVVSCNLCLIAGCKVCAVNVNVGACGSVCARIADGYRKAHSTARVCGKRDFAHVIAVCVYVSGIFPDLVAGDGNFDAVPCL